MPNDTSLVSVIIPAYNAAASIARTLRSVLTQTYRNLEVLVVDDGSTDQTPEIVAMVAQEDDRVKLLHQANAGVAAARNLAIAQALGEFIASIDADDIWYPENIERQVQCMMQGGNSVGLVYSWSVDIDESDALLGSFRAAEIQGNVFSTLVCHNFLGNASASIMRRSCLEQVGGYDPTLRSQNAQGCEDWDLYLRIAARYEFRVVPEFLVGYRKRAISMSCDYTQMARSHALVMQNVRQQRPEFPSYLFRLSSSNLYGYFAYQSHRCQDYRTTLYWLKQVIQADPVTPWIRIGFYRLLIQSLLGLRSSQPQAIAQIHRAPVSLATIYQRKGAIALKLFVGNVFHHIISQLAQAPQPLSAYSPCSES
ncbi:glycosyltransferase family 2 protein [Leptolyngbya sp. FACHB-321]|uniref:glycosyltransferase family 2 protein n=1 Tax=Leptolyngbya sp. FACHB-321 TaxID=2692807 RepID=UPI0016899FB2|nr:glycosyltransferase family A protein [Leptolyngbya sp. FACHB-321]MBD2036605.1 glycosyltransferase family 2 protein [Leptolyngbya sp. FACHB-321]